jgi:site-specific DNA-cytosine methylase
VLSTSGYLRRRLILLAARSDCKLPQMPSPTHNGPGLLPVKTCKEALQMFEKDSPTSTKSCGAVRIGAHLVFNHIKPSRAPKEDDFKLNEDEPSRTILARARPHRHYGVERFISVREAACLQSFPITYRFYGSLVKQYAQVGNAVPIQLATAIARSVAIVHGCAV